MDLPELGSFASAQPEAFYLGHEASELLATADAVLVVEGQRLNVHSQVLSVQSRVLRSLFAARAEGGGDGEVDGTEQQPAAKRARQGASSSRGAAPAEAAAAREPVVLEQALEGFRLHEVALFLRLTYHLEDAEPSQLHSELDSLAGAARLAHQLDAPRVLAALVAAMQQSVDSLESPSTLTAWLNAAEHCQLGELQASCIYRLAHLLLCGTSSDRGSGSKRSKRGGLKTAIADMKQLQGISHESLQVVVGALLSSARSAVAAPTYAHSVGRADRDVYTFRSTASHLPSTSSIQQVLGVAGGGESTGVSGMRNALQALQQRHLMFGTTDEEDSSEEEEEEEEDSSEDE